MSSVVLSGVRKLFGTIKVVKGVDLEVRDRELVVFVGPSGCGKSTLLPMIAGLEDVDYGSILIAGKDATERAPAKRGVAMMFQNCALYPHMSVYDNMACGLRHADLPKAEVDRRVRDAATLLQITELLTRRPKSMSGGHRQRVAIGRAIGRKPEVFLLDEPLSNLVAALRVEMRSQIARLPPELRATMIFVTHDQVEAMTLADRIVVQRGGAHRTDRHAARGLPPPRQHLCGAVHRLSSDQPFSRARAVANGRSDGASAGGRWRRHLPRDLSQPGCGGSGDLGHPPRKAARRCRRYRGCAQRSRALRALWRRDDPASGIRRRHTHGQA